MAARHRAEPAPRPRPITTEPDNADTVPVIVQQPEGITVVDERGGPWFFRFLDDVEQASRDSRPKTFVGRTEAEDPELQTWFAGGRTPFPARVAEARTTEASVTEASVTPASVTETSPPDAGSKPIRHRFGFRNAAREGALPTDQE